MSNKIGQPPEGGTRHDTPKDFIDKNSIHTLRRYASIPNCVHAQQGRIRMVVKKGRPPVFESLYMDGWDNAFWAPIPVLTENEDGSLSQSTASTELLDNPRS